MLQSAKTKGYLCNFLKQPWISMTKCKDATTHFMPPPKSTIPPAFDQPSKCCPMNLPRTAWSVTERKSWSFPTPTSSQMKNMQFQVLLSTILQRPDFQNKWKLPLPPKTPTRMCFKYPFDLDSIYRPIQTSLDEWSARARQGTRPSTTLLFNELPF